MEPALAAVMTLLVITGVIVITFFLTVHPIWAIVDVAISQNRSNGEKVVWIVFCFLTWTLASVLYGLIFASKPLAITTRVLVLSFVALAVATAAIMIAVPVVRDALPRAL